MKGGPVFFVFIDELVMAFKFEKRLVCSIVFALLFSLFSCKTIDVKTAGPFLSQNVNTLKDYNGKIVALKKTDADFFKNVELYKIKYMSDGLMVVGFIARPTDPNIKYPVMIYNRGGNREFGKITDKFYKYLTYLASKKYVVLASQYRGNDGGQGQEEFGGKDINDVLALIDLAKSLPYAKSDQIVMYGFSRGGMMTYLAIKAGADLKAAAVVGGVTDLEQNYNEREQGMKNVIEELVGFNKKKWKERSAYYWPEKINVPVLILHGEDDWRVKVTQAKKLAKRLKEEGKEHELVVFPNGDHGLNTHRTQRNTKIFDWFEKYIQRN